MITFHSYFCQAQFAAQLPESSFDKEAKIALLSPIFQHYNFENFRKFGAEKNTVRRFEQPSAVEKSFKVVEVAPYETNGATKFKIKLESAEKGTYYYDYDPKYDRNAVPAIIAQLELPVD